MNHQKLIQAFASALGIPPEQVNDELTYDSIPQWDSVAHMALVAELETVFEVMIDTDDVLAMSSVAAARNILAKHGVAV